jgi:hypothetical protein
MTGDFHADQFSDSYVDVIGQISGTSIEADNLLWEPSPVIPELTNQVNSLPADQQYSFIFRGSSQVLDHSLTTTNLERMITDFTFARGNSDVPSNLVEDDSSELRSSDHDGIVLYIKMDSDNDNVTDNNDFCPATSIPEAAPSAGIRPKFFALLDGDSTFDSLEAPDTQISTMITLDDTAGCSCEQIAEKFSNGRNVPHFVRHGCPTGLMKRWIRDVKHARHLDN